MRTACFDLDGCLVDSRDPISAAMNEALRQLGLPTKDPASLHGYIGPPLLGSFQQILQSLNADPALAKDAVAAYRQAYPDLARATTRPVPGVAELLTGLHGRMTLIVVTSKPLEYAEPILESIGLRGYFEAVFGPALGDLTAHKAAGLEQALVLAGVAQHERRTGAVMIGDRKHDVLAGKQCGTATIGVTWGIGDQGELTRAGADIVVDYPWELSAQLAVPAESPTTKWWR